MHAFHFHANCVYVHVEMATKSEQVTAEIQPTTLEPPAQEIARGRISSNTDGPRILTESEMIQQGEIDEMSYAGNIPPEMTRVDQKTIYEIYKSLKHLNILITGVTGSGKSALTNAFLGQTEPGADGAAKEGHDIKTRCTERVEAKESKRVQQIGIKIWDTPGLKDGSGSKEQKKYLDQIAVVRERYNPGDLVIFCIKADTRFVDGKDNMNVKIMIKLTKKFGKDFWKDVVIVLTFANTLETINPHWMLLSPEDKTKEFKEKIKQYEEQIRSNMMNCVKIDPKIVKNMKVVPAGHYMIPGLPDRKYWFSTLWFQCLDAITTDQAKAALVYSYQGRISEGDKSDGNPGRIVLTDDFLPEKLLEMKQRYQMRGGLLGMLGGPLGLVTIPLGMWGGELYGERVYKQEIKENVKTKI